MCSEDALQKWAPIQRLQSHGSAQWVSSLSRVLGRLQQGAQAVSIPYEELLMAPNREPAERLGAIVGRRFVFSREQWPAWERLVSKYGWPMVVKCADKCDPTKRFTNNVEALCIAQKYQEDQAEREAESRERLAALPKPTDHAARAALFREIMARHGVGNNATQETQQ